MLNEYVCIGNKDNKMILASKAIDNILLTGKKDKYYCPVCGEEMIFKNCMEKEKHFSHKADTKCTYGKGGESEAHKIVKRYVVENIGNEFVINNNEIIGNGKTFTLGGTRKVAIKGIYAEKSLKSTLGLNRDYRPDVLIETVTGELIALEIYKTHAKSDDDINNLKGKNIIVYEIDINNLKELDMDTLYSKMKLIYSINKLQLDNTLEAIRNEFKKLKYECCTYKDKLTKVESERNDYIQRYEQSKHELDKYKDKYRDGETQYYKEELNRAVCEIKLLNHKDLYQLDGWIKDIKIVEGHMRMTVGNNKIGYQNVVYKDSYYRNFLKDMIGAFGRLWIYKEGDELYLGKFRFLGNMLQNKGHHLYKKCNVDFYATGFLYNAVAGEINSWNDFLDGFKTKKTRIVIRDVKLEGELVYIAGDNSQGKYTFIAKAKDHIKDEYRNDFGDYWDKSYWTGFFLDVEYYKCGDKYYMESYDIHA